MGAFEMTVVIVAMVLVFKIVQMRLAFERRRMELKHQSPGPQNEDRLSRLEARLAALETLLIEQERRRADEEKWKALEH